MSREVIHYIDPPPPPSPPQLPKPSTPPPTTPRTTSPLTPPPTTTSTTYTTALLEWCGLWGSLGCLREGGGGLLFSLQIFPTDILAGCQVISAGSGRVGIILRTTNKVRPGWARQIQHRNKANGWWSFIGGLFVQNFLLIIMLGLLGRKYQLRNDK